MPADININIPGYELIKEIGAGGMAKVYLGMQVLLERKVAIKILHQRLSAESEEFKQRFFTEGKVLAKLQHDNIVSIIDIGEADGMLYMAMEYVEGGTLSDWLKTQELTVDQSIQICSKVGLALHATHMQHIVHRDLKPSNILLRDIYTPLLTDFGIARQTDQEHGLTQTGHILGTLQYMSPEQIRGLHVDHRSDIYSLGLMFYRLLVGKLPFVTNSQYDLSRMQCEEPPPPLPAQLDDIQPVMDCMLAKDPEERFQSCVDFCKAVQNLAVIGEDYATELEGATRIYDSSQLSGPGFSSRRDAGPLSERHSDRYSDRFSGRTSARTSGRYEETRMMGDQRGRAGSGWLRKFLLYGLPVLVLALAAGLYFAIWYVPSSGLSDANQRRLDNYLRRVDADLLKLQIDKPPKDNAVFELRKALALAPKYEPALDRARQIAEFYETDARDLIDEDDPEGAMEKISKGLDVAPEYENLVQLEKEITTVLAEQKRQAEIAEALRLAADYQARGMLIEPQGSNAYSAYKKVLDLDPQHLVANKGLRSILSSLLDEAEQTQASGQLEVAANQVRKAAELFPNSRQVSQLRARIESSARDLRDQAEVEKFLQIASQQMKDGKLIEPESDNALTSYTEVLNRQADNEKAVKGLSLIATRFTGKANAAFRKGDFATALKLAGNGLRAVPDNPELLAIQSKSTGQLGEREQEIQSKLQLAQRLLLSGDFLPPGDNALDLFKAVDKLDPGNEQAARGLASLPDQVYEEANQQQRLGNLRGARDLLVIAQSSFPEQLRFAKLKSAMDNAIAEQQKQERLQDMLDASATLIASRPITLDVIDRSAGALADLNKQFPGNLSAANQVVDLISAVASSARKVSAGGNEEAGFVLLARALKHFKGNQQLLTTRTALKKIKTARLAEEARQRAALMGQLAIDAVPWGEVTAIKDANGKPVKVLPGSHSTPMLVALTAGNYTVTIADSDGGSPRDLKVEVVAQQVVSAVAKFDTLTADEYFKRSSW